MALKRTGGFSSPKPDFLLRFSTHNSILLLLLLLQLHLWFQGPPRNPGPRCGDGEGPFFNIATTRCFHPRYSSSSFPYSSSYSYSYFFSSSSSTPGRRVPLTNHSRCNASIFCKCSTTHPRSSHLAPASYVSASFSPSSASTCRQLVVLPGLAAAQEPMDLESLMTASSGG